MRKEQRDKKICSKFFQHLFQTNVANQIELNWTETTYFQIKSIYLRHLQYYCHSMANLFIDLLESKNCNIINQINSTIDICHKKCTRLEWYNGNRN